MNAIKRAAELLRKDTEGLKRISMVTHIRDGAIKERTELAADLERMAQAEPVAGQCKFACEAKWKPCTVEHHYHVLANPGEWPSYETRLLYAAPPLPSDGQAPECFAQSERATMWRNALMAVASEVYEATFWSCCTGDGEVDLNAIVDRAMLAAAPEPEGGAA